MTSVFLFFPNFTNDDGAGNAGDLTACVYFNFTYFLLMLMSSLMGFKCSCSVYLLQNVTLFCENVLYLGIAAFCTTVTNVNSVCDEYRCLSV